MKRQCPNFSFLLLLLAITPLAITTQTNTIVLPEEAVGGFGERGVTLFGLYPVQQVYASAEFEHEGADQMLVTSLSLHPGKRLSDIDVTLPRVRIDMGVFSGSMDEIPGHQFIPRERYVSFPKLVFETNDFRVRVAAPTSPEEFPIRIRLQKPFPYHPRLGHLVVFFSKGAEERTGGTLFCSAHAVALERGRFTEVSSGQITTSLSIIATEFTYTTDTLRINSASIRSNVLRIDIATPVESASLSVEGALSVNGVYSDVQNVEYSQRTPEIIQAFVPVHHTNVFYRVRLE